MAFFEQGESSDLFWAYYSIFVLSRTYGEDIHDVGDNIWIKCTFLAKSNIYYCLKSPATEYTRFYHEFLWSANLAKHFVDYCQWATQRESKVSVFDFRTDFSRWLRKRHGMSPSFSHGIKSTRALTFEMQWQLISTSSSKRALVLMEASANIQYGTSFWSKTLYLFRSLSNQRP
jgi:hypothetical protein